MIGLLFSILMGLWPNPNPNVHPKPINGIGFTTMSDSTNEDIGGETGHTPPPPPRP